MELYFLRHGEANFEVENFNRPLTNFGREQVITLAMKWNDEAVEFDKIIVSPYKRTLETAEIMSDILNCSIVKDDVWMEFDSDYINEVDFQKTYEGFQIPKFKNLFEGEVNGKGESYWQLHSRAMTGIQRLIHSNYSKSLVVAHGGILNAAFRILTGAQAPVNGNGLYFQLGYAGYLHTEYKPEDNMWIIKDFNSGVI